MGAFIDLTGEKFGKWSAIELHEKRGSRTFWLCRCECSVERSVDGSSLRGGLSKSCGCVQREKLVKRNSIGIYKNKDRRLNRVWRGMLNRCQDKSNKRFEHYGGRGISVCDEWLNYDTFAEWCLSNGYSPDLTIERIDVNKGYNPENCEFQNHTIQAINTRIQRNNSSGTKGVGFVKRTGKWRARIAVDKKTIGLGSYNSKEEAIEKRKEAELKYWGFNVDGNGIIR